MRQLTLLSLLFMTLDVHALQNLVPIANGNVERLREVIQLANESGEPTRIQLRTKGTYVTSEGFPEIRGNIELEGSGATIRGNSDTSPRLFRVAVQGALQVRNLTIEGMGGNGGLSEDMFTNYGRLLLDRVTIVGNVLLSAFYYDYVRIIYNKGHVELRNTTITDNVVKASNGVSWLIRNHGKMRIINSTIARNETLHGAISYRAFATTLNQNPVEGESPTIVNSIIAGNLPKNCDGPIVSWGGNVDTDGSCGFDNMLDRQVSDADLGAVVYDRGLNPVLTIEAESPARGIGRRIYCEPVDGSGLARIRGNGHGSCDSGAFEFNGR